MDAVLVDSNVLLDVATNDSAWGDWSAQTLERIANEAIPDLYIGAHAAIAGYRLLTRGATRYRTYFSTLDVIAP